MRMDKSTSISHVPLVQTRNFDADHAFEFLCGFTAITNTNKIKLRIDVPDFLPLPYFGFVLLSAPHVSAKAIEMFRLSIFCNFSVRFDSMCKHFAIINLLPISAFLHRPRIRIAIEVGDQLPNPQFGREKTATIITSYVCDGKRIALISTYFRWIRLWFRYNFAKCNTRNVLSSMTCRHIGLQIVIWDDFRRIAMARIVPCKCLTFMRKERKFIKSANGEWRKRWWETKTKSSCWNDIWVRVAIVSGQKRH